MDDSSLSMPLLAESPIKDAQTSHHWIGDTFLVVFTAGLLISTIIILSLTVVWNNSFNPTHFMETVPTGSDSDSSSYLMFIVGIVIVALLILGVIILCYFCWNQNTTEPQENEY